MACITFERLNDALKTLPYARCYQSPFDKSNEITIEVEDKCGGNYSALVELTALAEKRGLKEKKYYEMPDIFGNYTWTAEFEFDKPLSVWGQNHISYQGEDGMWYSIDE